MNAEAQFKIFIFSMGFLYHKGVWEWKYHGNFLFFKIYFYDKSIVTMLPLSLFMKNIAVLCTHIIRENFLFILNKSVASTTWYPITVLIFIVAHVFA